jgi:hypothetical protein
MTCVRTRLRYRHAALATALVAALALGVGTAAAAAGTISFYGSVGNPINAPGLPNPLVVRPANLLLFQDGSWFLKNLRWSGWGSSVARANGVSSAKSPAGTYRNSPAQLVLSQPKTVLGHRVYSCYQLTIPATPEANQHACIGRAGKLLAYQAVHTAGEAMHVEQFLSADRRIWCELSNTPGIDKAWCGVQGPPEHSGAVHPNGTVTICNGPASGDCMQNWNPDAPVLKAGQPDELYGYRCSAQANAITCTVLAGAGKGKGFKITTAGAAKISG